MRLLGFDVVVVVVFVMLGRETHDEGNAFVDIISTAAPFLIALGLGWAITRAWVRPIDIRRGLGVAAVTVAGGMLLRRAVFDDGTAAAFVIVATAFNLAGMAGWRLLAARRLARRRRVAT